MVEFNIRTDSVDVEQIMRQIRARIKEKRGVDYTEQQIQELANVKLERFLDPKGVRSDLVEQFKRTRGTSPEPPNYGFEDTTLYETHRGIVRLVRKLLNPILKMFFNPNPIVHVLHMQGEINNINAQQFRVREELDSLYYEVIHNLVLEVTRLGIESKNLKMRLESLSSRMDFDERRARALEGVVQYKPGTGPAREVQAATSPVTRSPEPARFQQRPAQSSQFNPAVVPITTRPEPTGTPAGSPGSDSAVPSTGSGEQGADAAAEATARRRRRRRRGRRGGKGRGPVDVTATAAGTPPHGDPTADAALAPEVGTVGAAQHDAAPGHQPQSDYYDSSADGSDSTGSAEAEGPEPSDQ
jgi:hypothetical protein